MPFSTRKIKKSTTYITTTYITTTHNELYIIYIPSHMIYYYRKEHR
jgi:hypothetical protein